MDIKETRYSLQDETETKSNKDSTAAQKQTSVRFSEGCPALIGILLVSNVFIFVLLFSY